MQLGYILPQFSNGGYHWLYDGIFPKQYKKMQKKQEQ